MPCGGFAPPTVSHASGATVPLRGCSSTQVSCGEKDLTLFSSHAHLSDAQKPSPDLASCDGLTTSQQELPPAPRLRRTLTAAQLVVFTIFSTAGGPFGLDPAVRAGGPFLSLIVFLGLPIFWCLPIALTTAELATAHRENGGIVVYVLRAFGPFWAIQAGLWLFVAAVFNQLSFILIALDAAGQLFPFPMLARIPAAIAIIIVVAIISARGVDAVGRLGPFLLLLVLAPFAFISAYGIPTADWGKLLETAPRARGLGPTAAAFGAVLTNGLWNYQGFAAAGQAAGQVRSPKSTFPKAMLAACAAVAAIYIVPLSMTAANSPGPWSDWESGYIIKVTEHIAGHGVALAGIVAIAIGQMGLLLSGATAAVLSLEGLATNGLLPLSIFPFLTDRTSAQRRGAALLALLTLAAGAAFARNERAFEAVTAAAALLGAAATGAQLWSAVALRQSEEELAAADAVAAAEAAAAAAEAAEIAAAAAEAATAAAAAAAAEAGVVVIPITHTAAVDVAGVGAGAGIFAVLPVAPAESDIPASLFAAAADVDVFSVDADACPVDTAAAIDADADGNDVVKIETLPHLTTLSGSSATPALGAGAIANISASAGLKPLLPPLYPGSRGRALSGAHGPYGAAHGHPYGYGHGLGYGGLPAHDESAAATADGDHNHHLHGVVSNSGSDSGYAYSTLAPPYFPAPPSLTLPAASTAPGSDTLAAHTAASASAGSEAGGSTGGLPPGHRQWLRQHGRALLAGKRGGAGVGAGASVGGSVGGDGDGDGDGIVNGDGGDVHGDGDSVALTTNTHHHHHRIDRGHDDDDDDHHGHDGQSDGAGTLAGTCPGPSTAAAAAVAAGRHISGDDDDDGGRKRGRKRGIGCDDDDNDDHHGHHDDDDDDGNGNAGSDTPHSYATDPIGAAPATAALATDGALGLGLDDHGDDSDGRCGSEAGSLASAPGELTSGLRTPAASSRGDSGSVAAVPLLSPTNASTAATAAAAGGNGGVTSLLSSYSEADTSILARGSTPSLPMPDHNMDDHYDDDDDDDDDNHVHDHGRGYGRAHGHYTSGHAMPRPNVVYSSCPTEAAIAAITESSAFDHHRHSGDDDDDGSANGLGLGAGAGAGPASYGSNGILSSPLGRPLSRRPSCYDSPAFNASAAAAAAEAAAASAAVALAAAGLDSSTTGLDGALAGLGGGGGVDGDVFDLGYGDPDTLAAAAEAEAAARAAAEAAEAAEWAAEHGEDGAYRVPGGRWVLVLLAVVPTVFVIVLFGTVPLAASIGAGACMVAGVIGSGTWVCCYARRKASVRHSAEAGDALVGAGDYDELPSTYGLRGSFTGLGGGIHGADEGGSSSSGRGSSINRIGESVFDQFLDGRSDTAGTGEDDDEDELLNARCDSDGNVFSSVTAAAAAAAGDDNVTSSDRFSRPVGIPLAAATNAAAHRARIAAVAAGASAGVASPEAGSFGAPVVASSSTGSLSALVYSAGSPGPVVGSRGRSPTLFRNGFPHSSGAANTAAAAAGAGASSGARKGAPLAECEHGFGSSGGSFDDVHDVSRRLVMRASAAAAAATASSGASGTQGQGQGRRRNDRGRSVDADESKFSSV